MDKKAHNIAAQRSKLLYRAVSLILAIVTIAVFCYADVLTSRAQREAKEREREILSDIKKDVCGIASALFAAYQTSSEEVFKDAACRALVLCGRIEGKIESAKCASDGRFEDFLEYAAYVSDSISKFPKYPENDVRECCMRLRCMALELIKSAAQSES